MKRRVSSSDAGMVEPIWHLAQPKPFALSQDVTGPECHYYLVSQLWPLYLPVSILVNPSGDLRRVSPCHRHQSRVQHTTLPMSVWLR